MSNGPFELPERWRWAAFAEIARVAADLVDPTLTPNAPHIAPNHIESWTGALLPYKTIAEDGMTSAKHRFHNGQILYSKIRPYLAKAALATFDGLCSADMYPIDTDLEPTFLLRWMLTPTFTNEASGVQGRTVLPKINRDALARLRVPVAPINEQRRIVAKLDAIFEQTRAAKARLERLPALFVQLKRSVLAAAFRGDLTADWREANPDVEPANALAVRIRAQRDDRTSVPPDIAYSSQLSNAVLPDSWFVTATANVGHVQVGRRRAQGEYTGELHPYVRVANVADDRISYDDVNEMEFSEQELEQYLLRPGDIVLSEGQSLERVGQSAMYRDGDPAVCYQATLNRFRAASAGPLPEYAQLYFRFCLHTGVFRAAGSITTNIAHLTQEKLRRIPFILCPLEEQRVLVERVRGALARLDALETAVATARRKLVAVEQAALAKAFRGELVGQDPNDEPASALLDRLRRITSTENEPSPKAERKSRAASRLKEESRT